MFCSKCGEKLNEAVGFCPKCGDKVTSNVSVEGQQAPVEKSAPGKGLLKVIGILGLIFGGINSFVILFGFVLMDYWYEVMPPIGARCIILFHS